VYANFILTRKEPCVDGAEIELGTFSSGLVVVPAYPAMLEFAGVIQLAFEKDDPAGIYEVELRGTDLEAFDTHVLKLWPLTVPAPDDGWKRPRTTTILVPMREVCVFGDLDMALDVEVDRRWAARQTILVRSLSLA